MIKVLSSSNHIYPIRFLTVWNRSKLINFLSVSSLNRTCHMTSTLSDSRTWLQHRSTTPANSTISWEWTFTQTLHSSSPRQRTTLGQILIVLFQRKGTVQKCWRDGATRCLGGWCSAFRKSVLSSWRRYTTVPQWMNLRCGICPSSLPDHIQSHDGTYTKWLCLEITSELRKSEKCPCSWIPEYLWESILLRRDASWVTD